MAPTNRLGGSDLTRCWAAFASLGAGLIHLAVTREHLAEWWVYGVFFAVVGTAQVGWATVALGAPGRAPLWRLVAAANAAMVLLWGVTRATGLPVGPEPWTREAIGEADVLCVVLELAVIALLVVTGRDVGRLRGHQHTTGRYVALMFVGAVVVSAIVTPALASTEAGEHAHHHAARLPRSVD